MAGKNRRSFLKTLGLGSVALASQACNLLKPKGRTPPKPNIIFIMVDDMGYADLGCFGSKVIQTPRIDRMAAEGMRFTDAYSGCTVCAPARSTLMTGKHMGHTSVRGNTGGVPLVEQDVTVAEVLSAAGYAVGGFGKWGLGDIDTTGVPEKQGFDLFYGYYHQIHAHDYYPEYLVRNGRKVPLPGNKNGKKEQYTHHLIFKETIKFIRDNSDRPFFCYAPWTPPHGSYVIPGSEPAAAPYRDKNWNKNAKVIAAMDTMLDRHVGQVLDLLDELGIAEKTIVFFCSDNGAAGRHDGALDSSGPFRGQKRDMYEGGLRVPMIVRWPGQIRAGAVSDLPWYFPDVLPTLAELAGASDTVPTDVDGVSIVPTLLGRGKQTKRDFLYWEYSHYNWSEARYDPNDLAQAVRNNNWKMLRHKQDQPFELYDLSRDPGEKNNIAPQHQDVVAKLTEWIEKNRVAPRPQREPLKPRGQRFR